MVHQRFENSGKDSRRGTRVGKVTGYKWRLGADGHIAYLAIAAEFFGGLGLIVGLLSRIAAFRVAITMLVAMFKVHWQFGFFINWSGDKQGHGIEYHLLAIALAAVIIVHGAGAFSLDRALYRQFAPSSDNSALHFNLDFNTVMRLLSSTRANS
jgi:uncharacterized membrane protein YphA (DoxX/SURF4 family)